MTSYIASIKSQQEFLPLLGRHIDKAVPDGLHLKNNVCLSVFLRVWRVVTDNAAVNVKKVKEIPENNLQQFFRYVKKNMRCNKLSWKLKEWWANCQLKEEEFGFRFRGDFHLYSLSTSFNRLPRPKLLLKISDHQ